MEIYGKQKLGPVLRTHEPGQHRLLSFRVLSFRVSVGVVPQLAGAAGAGERGGRRFAPLSAVGGASRRLRRRDRGLLADSEIP